MSDANSTQDIKSLKQSLSDVTGTYDDLNSKSKKYSDEMEFTFPGLFLEKEELVERINTAYNKSIDASG